MKQGAARISREAGVRNAAVKANLLGRDQGSFVEEAQEEVANKVKLPPGYTLSWGGQFENSQRATQRLMVIVPLTILMIFSLLFWAFRSVRRAALVLFMVPFTLIGGIAGLALAGLHLSVSAAVGFIAVAGISVQNGVIMVEQIVELLRRERDPLRAAIEGAPDRLGQAIADLETQGSTLTDTAERARRNEVERALRKLGNGEDPQRVIEALSQALTNKLIHPPTHALNHASEAERGELAALLTRLYQIPRQE